MPPKQWRDPPTGQGGTQFPAMQIGMSEAYLDGTTWGFPGASVAHIETHAADVFLAGDRAFKIKKPVKLPYLDFSTREKRHAVLTRELEVNRAFAPDLYLGVTEIEGEPALVMRRFQARAMLSHIAEHTGVSDDLAVKLAAMAAEAHAIAPARATPGSRIMAGLSRQLAQAFTAAPDLFDAATTHHFAERHCEALAALAPLLDRRAAQHLVRRCHGDMHCANIVVIEDRPVLFDAIEFDETIATIDVLYDLAFLLMDLARRGQAMAANTVFNRYLHLRRAEEDLSGLAVLPLFLATRAGVRALVTADRAHELPRSGGHGERAEALGYFRSALAYLSPSEPRLVCIGGLSGTGKSTLARHLAPFVGPAPGALHVRSDVERKILAGVGETARLGEAYYTSQASARVYQSVMHRAEQGLAAGHSVIADAVFAQASERRAAEDLAHRAGAGFFGIWLEAPPAILQSRVSHRHGDASDATAEVVAKQLLYDVGTLAWSRLDASGSLEDTIERAKALL